MGEGGGAGATTGAEPEWHSSPETPFHSRVKGLRVSAWDAAAHFSLRF